MGIAINADGEFIIADNYETVKVFDNSGKFIYKFYPHGQTGLLAVATDEKYTYVLVLLRGSHGMREVQVFNRDMLRMKFDVLRRGENASDLTVGNGKVLV